MLLSVSVEVLALSTDMDDASAARAHVLEDLLWNRNGRGFAFNGDDGIEVAKREQLLHLNHDGLLLPVRDEDPVCLRIETRHRDGELCVDFVLAQGLDSARWKTGNHLFGLNCLVFRIVR